MITSVLLALALQAEPAGFRAAADDSRAHGGFTMLVLRHGKVLFEDAVAGHAGVAHELASGTKSFWGIAAAAAVQDGLFRLDDLASDTLVEWKDDPRKQRITIRQLLSLTAGLDPANATVGRIDAEDRFKDALAAPTFADPGAQFRYGPASFHAFGELLRRKLADRHEDPVAYLKRRVLDPIGMSVGDWTRDHVGNPRMDAGAHVTAREWAKLGEFVLHRGRVDGEPLVDEAALLDCFQGSAANPRYGMTFWLPEPPPESAELPADPDPLHAGMPESICAVGLGQQLLVIVPRLDLVIVRQGRVFGRGERGFDAKAFVHSIIAALPAEPQSGKRTRDV